MNNQRLSSGETSCTRTPDAKTPEKTLATYFENIPSDTPVVVACSGGVDSSVVAVVATKTLGKSRVNTVFFDTVLVSDEDRRFAKLISTQADLTWDEIAFDPLIIDAVRYNRPSRCYYCKRALFSLLIEYYPTAYICDGSNADDNPKRRPGMRALTELEIHSPLRECGFTKEDVRACARALGLANAARPSAPCRAVALPCDTLLTADLLHG